MMKFKTEKNIVIEKKVFSFKTFLFQKKMKEKKEKIVNQDQKSKIVT